MFLLFVIFSKLMLDRLSLKNLLIFVQIVLFHTKLENLFICDKHMEMRIAISMLIVTNVYQI